MFRCSHGADTTFSASSLEKRQETADDVFAILEATADDMDDFRTADPDAGFDFGTGLGFVNAEKALAAALGDLCHDGITITVKNSGAVSAHIAHGDQPGACE